MEVGARVRVREERVIVGLEVEAIQGVQGTIVPKSQK